MKQFLKDETTRQLLSPEQRQRVEEIFESEIGKHRFDLANLNIRIWFENDERIVRAAFKEFFKILARMKGLNIENV